MKKGSTAAAQPLSQFSRQRALCGLVTMESRVLSRYPLRAPQSAHREDEREQASHAESKERPDKEEGPPGPRELASDKATPSPSQYDVDDGHGQRNGRADQHDDVSRSPFGEQ